MSWWASLIDDRGHIEHEANYTHNCNRMVNMAATVAVGWQFTEEKRSWWRTLDGMDGADSFTWLAAIIDELEKHPDYYRAMNSPNDWGSYETLLPVLRGMRDVIPDWAATWSVSG